EMPLTPLSAPEMLSTPGPKNDAARNAVPVNDAPCAPSPSREADDARLRARHAENAGAQLARDLGLILHLPIDADPVERHAGRAGEVDRAAFDPRALRIAVLLDRPLGVGRDAGKSQHADIQGIVDGTEGLDRNIVVVGVGQKAE